MIKVGDVIRLKPYALQNVMPEAMPGKVVYVNKRHRYFTVEFEFTFWSFREAFKF